jgi:hypothetical protein
MNEQLIALVARVSTEFRTLRAMLTGSFTGDTSSLETAAKNIVGAINEVRLVAIQAGVINDNDVSSATVWSSHKTLSAIQDTCTAIINGTGAAGALQDIALIVADDPDFFRELGGRLDALTDEVGAIQVSLSEIGVSSTDFVAVFNNSLND